MEIGIIGFAGQSNMVGYRADPGQIPASDLDSKIPYSTYNNSTAEIGDAAGEYGILRPMLKADGGGNGWTDGVTLPSGYSSWGYGPEISCCRSLYSENSKIAAVKWALGGQSLSGTFNPSPVGFGYTGLKNYMVGMFDQLKSESYRPYWKGFVWWQGEEDSDHESQALDYYYNMSRFIYHIRSICKNPNLPFVIVKTVTPASAPYISEVQQAQQKIATDFNSVVIYDPTGLPMYSDNVHFNDDAMITAGNDIADLIKSFY